MVVASGDRATGQVDRRPSNKSPKGLRGALAVEANSLTGELFPETLPEDRVEPATDAYKTWYFLVHVADDRIQSELSLPSQIDAQGFIVGWFERILFPTITIDPSQIANDQHGFTPEVEIDVTRKRA
jgi:hypothetical protein